MAAGCTGRVGVDLAAHDRAVGVDERLAADELVVAGEHVDGRGQGVVAEVAGLRGAAGLAGGAERRLSASIGCSGHTPESMSPKMTPLPASACPPIWFQMVGAPMNSGPRWCRASAGVRLHRGHARDGQHLADLVAGSRTATPPYTRCRLLPALADGTAAPVGTGRTCRGRWCRTRRTARRRPSGHLLPGHARAGGGQAATSPL